MFSLIIYQHIFFILVSDTGSDV